MNAITLTRTENEPRVDSRQLANQLGTKHKNPMALIERYLAKFEEFGVVPFETEKPGVGTSGGRPERFVLLNEDQCYFLLSLSRNTDRVVELKASLIMAFREARYGHACQTLEARKKEASSSGRRLAHWRYDKPGVYAHVAHLREQLKLPLDTEDLRV
jgi:phage regulator Rha-like protein